MDQASALSRSGLAEARRAVRALRGDELPGPELIDSLVEQHRPASAGPLAFRTRGEATALPPYAAIALYRTAQEALSNVRKHAPGAAGFGLSGMAERAKLAGGELEAAPEGAGFRVRLVIPLTALPTTGRTG